jgi:hypothetical protein
MIWNYHSDHNDYQCACISLLNVVKTKSLLLSLKLNYSDKKTLYNQIALLLLLQNDSLIEILKFSDNDNHCVTWFLFDSNTLILNQH